MRVLAFLAITLAVTLSAREGQPYPAATVAIEALVRDALQDRFASGDLPDIQLLPTPDRVHVLKQMRQARLRLSKNALPAAGATRFELIDLEDARATAARTHEDVYFVTVDSPQVAADTATLWMGIDFVSPPQPGTIKMCCCAGQAELRRTGQRWIFARWVVTRCS